MTNVGWLGGDGGPLIIILGEIAPLWEGAANFDNSLMEGGVVETDYDVICDGSETRVINRYDRDMVVLGDSEWAGVICALPSGIVVAFQPYGYDGWNDLYDIGNLPSPPTSYKFEAMSDTLRLVVGADDGLGEGYGFRDVPITPGTKRCDVSQTADRNLVIIGDPDYQVTAEDRAAWRTMLVAAG